MPTLPSGRFLALSKDHIPLPGVVKFRCPEGHFWFQQLDRKTCPPPLEPDTEFLCDFVHAPCPTTRAEALPTLRVIERVGPVPGECHWSGYTLADPEALADLTPEDRAAWDAWLDGPKVAAFLDQVIAQCSTQAEANRENPGYMVFRSSQGRAPEVTLDQVLALSAANGRVCPMPKHWNELYDMLPGRRRVGAGWEPPAPLILAAWYDASDLDKMLRLREHLAWAGRHGALPAVAAFLESLGEGDWLHLGE